MFGENDKRYECKYVDKYNYTNCAIIINADFPVEMINHKRIKYISFSKITQEEIDEDLINYGPGSEPRIAYIADTENHCIRIITVATAYVSTIAGICGSPGHTDGPYT